MATDPNAVAELLRRARLSGQLSTTGAPPDNTPTPEQLTGSIVPGQVQAPVAAPPQSSPRDAALNDYKQALSVPAPNQSDYHPSITRRIVAGLLGGIAGLHDPKTGYEVGHGIANQKFEQDLSDYQKRLQQKKDIYDTEETASLGGAKTAEQVAQKGAEEARMGAENAKRQVDLYGISPEGQAAKLKLAQVEHPGSIGKVLYEVPLKNGETTIAYEGVGGTLTDVGTGTPLGPNSYDATKVKKVGSEGTDKPVKPEKPSEYEDFKTGYLQKHPKATGDEVSTAYSKKSKDSGASDIINEFKMQTAREVAKRAPQKVLDTINSHLESLDTAIRTIDTSKPEQLAIAIPATLKALVSGQGSGFRMTQSEMDSLVKNRGLADSFDAFISKIQGKGQFSDKDKADLKALLNDTKAAVSKKRDTYNDYMDKIDSAKNPDDLGKASIEHRKSLSGKSAESKELPGGITLDDINAEIERRKKK